jgi:hypothetical protein
MTSSGTTTFAPSIGSITQYAFGLCGIRRTELTQQHFTDAAMATNLLLAQWDNNTPNTWKVDLVSQALTQGTATYSVDPSTVIVLDAYIRTNSGQQDQNDRLIWPISRTEYAAMPNKDQQGTVTTFWFDRLLNPTITLWEVPDNSTDILQYYRVTQIYDANQPNGETFDLPVWWLPSMAYGLGAMLADLYAPDRSDKLQAKADKMLMEAREQNTEASDTIYIAPAIQGYFVR